jgi:hypothetical protein
VLKSPEASPKGQALRMKQESIDPGYPVENPDAGIGREASVRAAGHKSPILRRQDEPGKAQLAALTNENIPITLETDASTGRDDSGGPQK